MVSETSKQLQTSTVVMKIFSIFLSRKNQKKKFVRSQKFVFVCCVFDVNSRFPVHSALKFCHFFNLVVLSCTNLTRFLFALSGENTGQAILLSAIVNMLFLLSFSA
jgi:hypothetical protein